MTILIKGIDMPPDIEGAEVIIHIKPDGTVFDMRGVHLQAQAAEVPTPHGRLIDADAFIVEQCHECDGCCEDTDCACLDCTSDNRCEFMQDIADAPTIIEAEEG